MNKTNLFLAALISVLTAACVADSSKLPNLKDLYNPQDAVINGKILNHKNHPEVKTIDLFVKDLVDSYNNSHTESIQEDGTFQITVEKSYPGDILFRYNQNIFTVYIEPGDNVQIEIDADKFLVAGSGNSIQEGAIQFAGDNGVMNNEIWMFQTAIYNHFTPGNVSDKEVKLEEAQFLTYMDSIKNIKYQVLDSLNNVMHLSKKFTHWAQFSIDYEYATRLLHYIWYHPQANRRKMDNKPLEVSAEYLKAIHSIELDNRKAIICSDYRGFLLEHNMNFVFDKSDMKTKIKSLGGQFVEGDEFEIEYRKFLDAADELYQGIAKDIVLSQRLYDLIFGFRRMDVFENLYPEYKTKLNTDFIDCLEVLYEKAKPQPETETKEVTEEADGTPETGNPGE